MPTDAPSRYNEGRKLKITSHRPLVPFDYLEYKEKQPEDYRGAPTSSDTLLEYVLKTPLLKTEDVSNPRENTLTLEKQLSGKEHGCRVLICRLGSKIDGCDRVVAKVYDPLCYPWVRNELMQQYYHVVFHAERDYTREATAYEHAQKLQYDGQLTPKYYGSWTCEIGPKSRSVRLILTEYIDGQTLYEAYYRTYARRPHIPSHLIQPNRPPNLPDRLRLDILGKAMIIQIRQLNSRLNQNDFAPRNVIALLDRSNSSDSTRLQVRRVVLIDYNTSKVSDKVGRTPQNPMVSLWNGSRMPDWVDWLPVTWKEDTVARRKWLYQTFGSSDVRKLYQEIEPEEWKMTESWAEAHK